MQNKSRQSDEATLIAKNDFNPKQKQSSTFE